MNDVMTYMKLVSGDLLVQIATLMADRDAKAAQIAALTAELEVWRRSVPAAVGTT